MPATLLGMASVPWSHVGFVGAAICGGRKGICLNLGQATSFFRNSGTGTKKGQQGTVEHTGTVLIKVCALESG